MIQKEKLTEDQIRERINQGKYIVDPIAFCGKEPKAMSQDEALKWEKECLSQRLRISAPNRRSGLLLRINEINHHFKIKAAKKAYTKAYAKDIAFENEDVEDEEEPLEDDYEEEEEDEVVEEEIDHEAILAQFENEVVEEINQRAEPTVR